MVKNTGKGIIMKYRLTDETRVINTPAPHVLHRIECVEPFANIHKGDKGGWVESEKNLSQDEWCWLFDDAVVYGDAVVKENARLYDEAWVCGNAVVGGYSVLHDEVYVGDSAHVGGFAILCGNVDVLQYSKIEGKATIDGDSEILGDAYLDRGTYKDIKAYRDNESGEVIIEER